MNSTILLVDDDEDDIYFMRRAFKEAGLTARLEVVNNGQAAIDYLSGSDQFRDRERFPLPQFVFLDLKMPIVDGFDVLAWAKGQRGFEIPIAILSSSPEEQDMNRARELGARCYLIKPPTPQMLHACRRQFELS